MDDWVVCFVSPAISNIACVGVGGVVVGVSRCIIKCDSPVFACFMSQVKRSASLLFWDAGENKGSTWIWRTKFE